MRQRRETRRTNGSIGDQPVLSILAGSADTYPHHPAGSAGTPPRVGGEDVPLLAKEGWRRRRRGGWRRRRATPEFGICAGPNRAWPIPIGRSRGISFDSARTIKHWSSTARAMAAAPCLSEPRTYSVYTAKGKSEEVKRPRNSSSLSIRARPISGLASATMQDSLGASACVLGTGGASGGS
jgi:hypothetical protein